MMIEQIKSPSDLKGLTVTEMEQLAAEIRQLLIAKLSKHGGHCGPNLGMVEATLALHRVFARVMPENTPSLRLLEAIGFTCEGTEYACTQIQGKWEDHIRYALLNPYSSI